MKNKTLTQTQAKVLRLGHDKGNFTAQDLPLNGGARKKVIDSLLNRELIKPINRKGEWFTMKIGTERAKRTRLADRQG